MAAGALLLAVSTLAVPACTSDADPTGPVGVELPDAGVSAAVARTCRELLAAVPERLRDDLPRRPVRGDATRTAAWGDPPVQLACGVPPAPESAEPVEVGPPEGGTVAFEVEDVDDGVRWTTRDRTVPVAITVPDQYDSQVVVRLTGALLRTVPRGPT